DAATDVSDAFRNATTLGHLAATVAAADGPVTRSEAERLTAWVGGGFEIAPAEHDRLFAHMLWLSTTKITLGGLKPRIDELDDGDRISFGDALITIAAAEGAVSPAAMTAITKAFRTLGLDSDT